MKKYSVTIAGHATSVSLEKEFWEVLKRMAQEEGISQAELIRKIDAQNPNDNLSSTLRLAALDYLKTRTNLF